MDTQITKGSVVWLFCEVRPGPFPDERKVYVKSEIGDWFGFVNTSELETKVSKGKDRVRGHVLAVEPSRVLIGINGQSPATKTLNADLAFLGHHGSFQTGYSGSD